MLAIVPAKEESKGLPNKKIKSIFKNNLEALLHRKKLNNYLIQNGTVYVFNTKNLRKTKTYYSNKTYEYLMHQRRSIDIDNEIDVFLVEETMKKNCILRIKGEKYNCL